MDQQYHEIQAAILGLQKELRNGLAEQPLAEKLSLLLQALREHFRFEESYRVHMGLPEREGHQAERDQFITHILQLRDRAEAGDHAVSLELSSVLFNWLRNRTHQER